MGISPRPRRPGERVRAASLTAPECEVLPVLPGLGDPVSDRGGDIGVAVTDTGCARYVTLCQIHSCPDAGRPPAKQLPATGR